MSAGRVMNDPPPASAFCAPAKTRREGAGASPDNARCINRGKGLALAGEGFSLGASPIVFPVQFCSCAARLAHQIAVHLGYAQNELAQRTAIDSVGEPSSVSSASEILFRRRICDPTLE